MRLLNSHPVYLIRRKMPMICYAMLCYAALCYAFNFQAKYVVRDPFASRSEMLFNLHIMTNPPQSLHSPPSSTIHADCVVWTNADTET